MIIVNFIFTVLSEKVESLGMKSTSPETYVNKLVSKKRLMVTIKQKKSQR